MSTVDQIPEVLRLIKGRHPELATVSDALLGLYEGLTAQRPDVDMSYVNSYPPGHYYTPLPSAEEVRRVAARVWRQGPHELAGIDLRVREQQKLFARFLKHFEQMPFTKEKREGYRYYFDNVHFCQADAVAPYCMLREFRPQRVIEVGSGFTSCVMLDTNQHFLGGSTRFTFIEPYPERLLSNMTPEDAQRVRLIDTFVQDVDLAVFSELEENDILFLDCSHVGKVGSDVLHLLFEVLPRLAKGVIVHFHDIFYPFEYPRHWVVESRRAWNENYFARAFLQYNQAFEIMYFNNYLGQVHQEMLTRHMPVVMENIGGSLWLRKTA